MYTTNVGQIAFRESLVTNAKATKEQYQANFDNVIALANAAEGNTEAEKIASMTAKLPAAFAPLIAGAATLVELVDKVLANANWGDGVNYKVATTAKPIKAKAPKAVKVAAAPPVAGDAVPAKRRGNPEALKRAREAKGSKTPEQVAADRQLVVDTTVTYLKTTTNATTPVAHVKDICIEVEKLLVGKGSDGKGIKSAVVYGIITEIAKDPATTPFIKTEMEGRKIGYALKA